MELILDNTESQEEEKKVVSKPKKREETEQVYTVDSLVQLRGGLNNSSKMFLLKTFQNELFTMKEWDGILKKNNIG